MLTCKEASVLATKAMDGKLTFRERVGLRLHIAMCGLCRRYVRDTKRLREAIRNAGPFVSAMMPESVKLSERSCERITQMLKEYSDESR
ncbi:zf-HC2 domain-containing protein [Methylotuvimicrobium sp. KM1]|uniref:zf-HC2 domain-containing protein n=1 Tax=Methylotuvimicrobium sp. KM1 TaxID=3377707 RepID=UPI00384BEDED